MIPPGPLQRFGRRLDEAIARELEFLALRMNNFSADFPTRMNITRDIRKIGKDHPVSGDEIARILRGEVR